MWQDVLLDLHDSDVKSIDNLKIKDFYFPGEVSHTSASRDSLYIVAVDKEGTSYRFPSIEIKLKGETVEIIGLLMSFRRIQKWIR